jgi:glycosyltransferase involved in cell wall biosynthesis
MADFTDFVKTLETKAINEVIIPDQQQSQSPLQQPLGSVHVGGFPIVLKKQFQVKAPRASIKLLLISTHINQASGYAKVSHGLIRQLATHAGLQIVHFAIQASKAIDFKRTYPSNVKVISAVEKGKPEEQGFGYSEIANVIKSEEPHVLMIYNDIGVCIKYLEKIAPLRVGAKGLEFQIWTYLDQVYECQHPQYLEIVQRETDRFFCFTKEWRNILKNQGITRPIDILQHGFDRDLFPVVDRNAVRASNGIPKDVFLFLSMNRNQPRKRLDLLIMAFVELILAHPTKSIFLLCVCDKGDKGGFPLYEIFEREIRLRGIAPEPFANRLIITPKDMSYLDTEIGNLYQIADVGLSTADGEGFGLCSFEQMGLGIPQVLTNVVGHRDYCNQDNAILVEPYLRSYLPLCTSILGGETKTVNPSAFAKAMAEYVLNPDLVRQKGLAAKKTVEDYTWQKVTTVLQKRLIQVQEDLYAA